MDRVDLLLTTSIEMAPWTVRADEAATSEIGPGLLAFAIVTLLAVATFILIRSMLHHLSKVPPTFDEPGATSSAEAGEEEPSDPGLNER